MRLLVEKDVPRYFACHCRLLRSQMIRSTVENICEASPEAGFVQRCDVTGCWYVVDRATAHEKVGHSFRDYVKKADSGYTQRPAPQQVMRLHATPYIPPAERNLAEQMRRWW
jgi:hypothetical protein